MTGSDFRGTEREPRLKDSNGFRIHPGHDGLGGPLLGELVWLVRRTTDDKLWGLWPTRHHAVGWLSTSAVLATNPSQDLEPVAVPVGSVRLGDVIVKDPEPNRGLEDEVQLTLDKRAYGISDGLDETAQEVLAKQEEKFGLGDRDD